MIVLIVDDEQHAREAAKLLVPWEQLGVTELLEAENGAEAQVMIAQKHPAIIVTDMHMPLSDGMQLIEWVSDNEPDAKLIVISGYNDFKYVRHTLKHGGIDYLLKPIDPAQLLTAVHRAIELRQQEEQERIKKIEQGITMNQYKPVYRDYLFGQLIAPKHSETEAIIRQLADQFPKIASASECRAALFPLHAVMHKLLRRFGGDRDLAVFALQNVLNDFIVNEWCNGCAFRSPSDPEELIVLFWQQDNNGQCCEGCTEQLVQALRNTFDMPFYAGLSRVLPFPQSAADAVESARRGCLSRNLLADGGTAVWSEASAAAQAQEAAASPLPDLTTLAEPIRLALLGRDEPSLRATLEPWFRAASKLTVISPLQVERWQKQLDIAASRWQHRDNEEQEKSLVQPFSLPFIYDDHGTLSLERTKQHWLERLLEHAEAMARLQRQERSVIADMIEYIERHLQEDLSLQQLAARFFLSREYVSRRFRQETGVTLSEYVERHRMEHATKLLANRSYKVADIAEIVGYTDEKYFSKVFKKHTGLSPQQYRKSDS
ncbi:two-component system response regulator YesN [Paenibacillus cellulosilyticus]|uniref:Two-component system response regulator YesN n=1 Tax=Paenibacillus cellulosilyticus TaxID=375489 RepID=A0A2V2YPA3_9BACL|nr:helix-turn-helix domain-containing protein [Paenibacillus cellulosilyticus]PWV97853.1 two-component system response regulator YesN [Paenibacillus cellulosilyticus]QKS46976.1 helix-turn-helix domain-containing protein [Paenibacillus cellulosilyticus]